MAEITHQNFSWEETNKDLVIYIPNYGRGHYIEYNSKFLFSHELLDKYLIVVLNDGIHQDFDYLKDYNVRYLTIKRDPPTERNGSFIRNYAIKRNQSKIIAFKDPETLVAHKNGPTGFIKSIIDNIVPKMIWRPCITSSLTKEETLKLFNGETFPSPSFEEVDRDLYYRLHWFYAIESQILKSIHGYDERFTHYGPEDHNLFLRLRQANCYQFLDENSNVYHLWHDMPTNVHEHNWKMHKVLNSIDNRKIISNENGWGEG